MKSDGEWMRTLRLLSSGAMLLGWYQAFGMINFNQLFAQFLSTIASLLAALFFGGDLGQFGDGVA